MNTHLFMPFSGVSLFHSQSAFSSWEIEITLKKPPIVTGWVIYIPNSIFSGEDMNPNYNNGRPFILAGHSQGSAICTLVLQKYFKEHPEYYKRMVAAYIIGFSVTKDELKANPHLKFATGENDTGVIVSWNTEGAKNIKTNAPNAATLPNAISINPLNWKLDATYAPASKNLGSLVPDEKTGKTRIGDLGADAQVVPARGVIVTNAKFEPMELTELFGPQSFHNGDYIFYYNNLKDNVAKRIAAYRSRTK